ncbi:hypothetical protein [Dongia sp.]|uniref:hypothetical protein n=1 Tax=Dongia sp. TaxID=1977262 RepID=UPI003752496E
MVIPVRPPTLLAIYALVLAGALLPVLLSGVPPLADLPNHLARAHIIDRLSSSPDLQKYYAVEWRLLSFQSTDFILPALARVVGLAAAAKVFVAATMLLLLAGTAALHRALYGQVGLWPAVSALFLFNFLLAWGFVAFLSAAGLALLLFAAWVQTSDKAGAVRMLLFAIATVLLLLCHLFAFACYAVLVGGYEIGLAARSGAPLRRRILRLASGAASFVPAIVLAALSIDTSVRTILQFGGIADLARGFVSPTIMYLDWADLVVTYAVALVLWLLYRRQALSFDRRMLVPLAILFLLALVMPVSMASVWGANLRIPCLLAFLLVASSDLRLPQRAGQLLAAGLVLLLATRAVALSVTWSGYERDVAEFRAADQQIARGSRVLATAFPVDYQQRRDPAIFPLVHLAAFSVIDRDAFLPSLFTFATPLRFTADRRDPTAFAFQSMEPIIWQPRNPAFAPADATTRQAVADLAESNRLNDSYLSVVDWAHWPEDFHYLVVFDFDTATNPVPALLTEVARGRIFTLYRIHPPQ